MVKLCKGTMGQARNISRSGIQRLKGTEPESGMRLAIILALFIAVMASFWPALEAGFIYDDRFFVVENQAIRDIRNIAEYFTSPQTTTASVPWNPIWRPLRNLSYAIDYQFWGLRPIGFHLTNLWLHWLNGILFFLIARRFFSDSRSCLLAAGFFILHPAQVETVAWVSGRDDLLMALFILGSWRLRMEHQASGKKVFLILALLSFTLALFSKETAAAMPLALPLIDRGLASNKEIEPSVRRLPEYLLWFAIAGIYFFIRLLTLGQLSHRQFWGGSPISNFLTMLWVAAQYLRLVILPLWLRVDYVIPPVLGLMDWRWAIGLASLITTFLLAWRYRRLRWPLFAWLWFFIFLLPVANIVPIAAIMAERFLYIPLVAVALLLGYLGTRIRDREKTVLAAGLFIILGGLSMKRGLEWREPGTFWRTEIKRSPGSAIAHNNLGHYFYRSGVLDSAEFYFLKAAALNPNLAIARACLGDVYYHRGDYEKALEQYEAYLKICPRAPNRSQTEQRMRRIREKMASGRTGDVIAQ